MVTVEVKLAFVVGALLMAVGLFGYFVTGMESWTAAIPAIPGLLMVIGAFIAIRPNMLKHGMHVAAGAALLGLLGSAHPLMKVARGAAEPGPAFVSGALMFILCLIFVIVAVRSFINARKARQASEPANDSAA